ncbi:zf-HC2 domain-containing protein, partial [Candidatus Sumerlaeota bacterium]|nr:zf-HC2 domain-containing protein [Candidatus Sumerlaeota bacterium]
MADYISGLLPPEDRDKISLHLEDCAHCLDKWAAYVGRAGVRGARVEGAELQAARLSAGAVPVPATPPVDRSRWLEDLSALRAAFLSRDFSRIKMLLDQYPLHALTLDSRDSTAAQAVALHALYLGARNSQVLENSQESLEELKRVLGEAADWSQASAELRLAEGIVAVMEHEFDAGQRKLEAVVFLASDPYLIAMGHHYRALCWARKGVYEKAWESNRQGAAIAEEMNWVETCALFAAQEAWLLFQNGRHEESLELVEHAREVLSRVADHAAVGDLNFCAGRVCKREGRAAAAIEFLNAALKEYAQCDGAQSAMGRVHLRLASVQWDMAGAFLARGFAVGEPRIAKLWGNVEAHLNHAD